MALNIKRKFKDLLNQPIKLETALEWQSRVVAGNGLGKKIDYPTANFEKVPSWNEMFEGVYFGEAKIHNKTTHCLAYFGKRHVLNQDVLIFEVNLLNWSQDIYGQKMSVKLTHFLRPPLKLKNLKALKKTLDKDLKIACQIAKKG